MWRQRKLAPFVLVVINISRQGKTRIYGTGANGVRVPSWFGDGSDGDLVVAANETVALECIKDQQQIIKQYNNVTIEAGGKLIPQNRCPGMVLMVRGDFTLNGEINVDKMAPCEGDYEARYKNTAQVRLLSTLIKSGAGGKGGNGYTASSGCTSALNFNTRTIGGDGGAAIWCGGGNGGGGGASGQAWNSNACDIAGRWVLLPVGNGSAGTRPKASIGLPYTNPSNTYNSSGVYGTGGNTRPQDGSGRGGRAPGGSGGNSYAYKAPGYSDGLDYPQSVSGSSRDGSAGDAYGGGAVWIFVQGKVTIGSTAVISADGGNGANGAASGSPSYNKYSSGAGGGGGGGIIALIYNEDITMMDGYNIAAEGGKGGKKATSDSDDATNGTDGEAGVPLIMSLNDVFSALATAVSL